MAERSEWDGVFVFPVTPMDDGGGKLNAEALPDYLEPLLGEGVHGVVPLGSTGEFAYLGADERREVIRATVEVVDGRVKVIAGASAIATRDAIAFAQEAEALGADAVLILLQSYFTLGEEEILGHFSAIAEAIEVPVFIYNNTASSGHDISASLVQRLVELAGITGFKESSGGLDRVMELDRLVGDRIVVHCGWEQLALPMFCLGVRGWASAMANLIPERCVELYTLAVERADLPGALEVHRRIAPLSQFLMSVPLAPAVKDGLALLGRDVGVPRPPLSRLDPEDRSRLAALLELARSDGATVAATPLERRDD